MLQWLSLGPKDFNEDNFKELLEITKFEPEKI